MMHPSFHLPGLALLCTCSTSMTEETQAGRQNQLGELL
jgi:hypothetical protein